jgi:hypothetical protein
MPWRIPRPDFHALVVATANEGGSSLQTAVRWLIGIACVVAMLVLFWPTPYRYENGGLTRINRFTGKAEQAMGDGWVAVDQAPTKKPDLTGEIQKAFEEVTVTAQDFDSITVKNPTEWGFVLIDRAQVDFDAACGGASDYVTLVTADRPLDAGTEKKLRLPYDDRLRKTVTSACGGGKHGRTLTLIVNSASHRDGRRWDNVSSVVARKSSGDVDVPAS